MAAGRSGFAASSTESRPVIDALSVEEDLQGCITTAALADRVAAWMERDHLDAGFKIELKTTEGVLAFRLTRPDQSTAERRFGVLPTECDNRLRAVSLAIALAIDHTVLDRVAAETEPTLVPADAPDVAAVAEQAPPPPATLSPPTTEDKLRGRRGLAITAGGAAVFGVLPSLRPAALLGIEAALPRAAALRIQVMGTTEDEASLGRGLTELRLLAARLQGCWLPTVGPARVGGCAGTSLGLVLARGAGFAQNLSGVPPWWAMMAGVGVQYPAQGPIYGHLHVEGVWVLHRPGFEVTASDGEVLDRRTLSRLGAVTTLEIGFRLP